MAKKSSFLDRIQPLRARERLVDWPLPCAEEPTPKVRVRVLTQDDMEAAYFSAKEHFVNAKKAVKDSDPVMIAREHTELVFLAFSDPETGEPIAESSDEIANGGPEFVDPLYRLWGAFQSELTVRPLEQKTMDALIEHLKKNTNEEALLALHSTWLAKLVTTLVSRLPDSTSSSDLG
jgi:hypothetical protein